MNQMRVAVNGSVRIILTHKDGSITTIEDHNTLTKRFRDWIQSWLALGRNGWSQYPLHNFSPFHDGSPKELGMHKQAWAYELSQGRYQEAVGGYNYYRGDEDETHAQFSVGISGGAITWSKTVDFTSDTFTDDNDDLEPIKMITLGQRTHINHAFENTSMDFDKIFAYYVFPSPIDPIGSNIETMEIQWVWQFSSPGSITNASLNDMWGLFSQNNDPWASTGVLGANKIILYEDDHLTEIENDTMVARPGDVSDYSAWDSDTQALAVYQYASTHTNDSSSALEIDVVEISYAHSAQEITLIYKDGFDTDIPAYSTWNLKWVLVVEINSE